MIYPLFRRSHLIDATHYWTDSRTILCWLRSETRKYKQFVAYRVGEILESTELSNWHWVPTKLNPADDATRDLEPANLSNESRWFTGPEFLKSEEENWPTESVPKIYHKQLEEEIDMELPVLQVREGGCDFLPDVSRFSSWSRLIRATAWMNRFIANCRSKKKSFLLN